MYIYLYINIYIIYVYILFTTNGFFKIAIES